MSYARNLSRLSRTGLPSVGTAQELRDLVIYSGIYPEAVETLGAASVGDGGGGTWRWNSASTAADNVGTVIQPASMPASGRYERCYSGYVNVRWFGATGDNVTDNTTAIKAAIADAKAKTVFFPAGDYIITDTLHVHGVNLLGERGSTTIINNGTGTDAILFSEGVYTKNQYIENLDITGSAGSGHCINIGFGGSICRFAGMLIYQLETTKSCISGEFIGNGGIYDAVFENSEYRILPSATAPAVSILCDGGPKFNENEFRNLRLQAQGASATHLVDLRIQNASAYLHNICFNNIDVEQPVGGFIKFCGTYRLALNDITIWDLPATTTDHLIECVDSVSATESLGTSISSFGRTDGTLGVGFHDIEFGPMQDTELNNITTSSSLNPSINTNGKRFTSNGFISGITGTLTSSINYIINSTIGSVGAYVPRLTVGEDILAGKLAADSGATEGLEFVPATGAKVTCGSIPVTLNRTASGTILSLKQNNTAAGGLVLDSVNGIMRLDFTGGVGLRTGAGSPEGVIAAATGSIYMRTDGGAGTTLYVKESGASNTGWVAK